MPGSRINLLDVVSELLGFTPVGKGKEAGWAGRIGLCCFNQNNSLSQSYREAVQSWCRVVVGWIFVPYIDKSFDAS